MLLVGVWANRNWILGNWLREAAIRSQINFDIRWVPFIYANKRRIERYLHVPLPKRNSYFFSYITIFEHYLNLNKERFREKSIVLYPHNETEMGSLDHQAQVLNQAYKVYFFCSADARQLVKHGLVESKVEIALCAVDDDCVLNSRITKSRKTVILASRFGPRKGLEILPMVVKAMPDFRFIGLGRGWEDFIEKTGLAQATNFEHYQFSKETRNQYFSEAGIFLSLSNLEGGPVPLIESISMGCIPVATRTGFAPDLVEDKRNGLILPLHPSASEVEEAIRLASTMKANPVIGFLTWDRITQLMIRDKREIESLKGSSVHA
jgi:glycosyltransferase involved in cell wall biosynthesis